MATVGRNFCIAPFTQLTFAPSGNYSPCPEIGGRAWKDSSASPVSMWTSSEYNELRQSFNNNEQSPTCNRCWQQEENKNQSLRRRLLAQGSFFKPGQALEYIDQKYKIGPQQVNIITGNKCNLRCRICKADCSWTYNIEGRAYEKQLGRKTIYTSDQPKPVQLSDQQLDEIFEISGNLKRLEFYGGEPLLDDKTIRLLKRLVDSGRSQNISIMYNTNGVNLPTQEHFDLWPKFKNVDFNISVDDIQDRFTYNRHPAKWSDLLKTIDLLKNSNPGNYNIFSICTVSVLNVYYVPEILDALDQLGLKCFINHVFGPTYYEITHLPIPIKQAIKQKLESCHHRPRLEFLLNMLNANEDLKSWEDFKFWTHTKDQYRGESFKKVYPEFYEIIKEYDKTIPF